ncbi:PhnD/SsuA/transferrin family substrate-binding protein [Rhodoferax sp.]|uniref:PhnD/SsuA/transferrin family substrate-binding protein n=1 Tax=Rhodoferax sp. TaxID=50421 RepID=UPI00272877B7|nr:PhnD/SsuA/transferrin family substrate-binding protein [Rhodoferax sp.]MDO8317942.1 PhnD/SsuA/transferrin family substrate-binding protein [Rhodoferax sp.]MDP2679427.1 PhnD/SsuA/transferrin family substrate-binding protein [Rhodoferax sp.]
MQRRTLLEFGVSWSLLQTSAQAQDRQRAAPLRIGLTAVILADQAAFLTRWSDYLGSRMGVAVVFVARESYQNILDLLLTDQLDAAWICGYPFVLHQSRLQLLATPLFNNRPFYQSYLIGQQGKQGLLSGWSNLRNQVLAYSDPLSNSGWLVAQAQLRAVGLTPRDLRRSFFAHGHRNVAEAVASGLAQAGCIDGYVWETMQLQKMAAVEQTDVLWRSDWYAFPPMVAKRNDNNPALWALGEALQSMTKDEQGASLLRALNLTGFAKPDAALFEPIKALAASVNMIRA